MAELTYALNKEGRLVHVDCVPNGLACGCRCPGCGAPLVAKNNGETVVAHFAHASGVACAGALESELHLLAKEVISETKAVMLPHYGAENVYDGGLVRFDEVEVEERNDVKSLQPDLCGVVHRNTSTGLSTRTNSRLWIEIRVTHAIGPEKRTLIQRNGIACVEINMGRFIGVERTKEQVRKFLLEDKADREWTNNPVLEKKRQRLALNRRQWAQKRNEVQVSKNLESKNEYEFDDALKLQEREFMDIHRDVCVLDKNTCYTCKHHTTLMAILEEVKRLHFPMWLKGALSSNLLYWTKDRINSTVCYDRCYRITYNTYQRLLPTASPDILGHAVSAREIKQNEKIIPFLLETVPAIIATEGTVCKHCVDTFCKRGNKYDIACNMPNVVHKHRRG